MDPHSQNEGPDPRHEPPGRLAGVPRPGHEAGAAAGHLVEDHRRTPSVWEFKLREGVKYHSNPFPADDVVFHPCVPSTRTRTLLTSVVRGGQGRQAAHRAHAPTAPTRCCQQPHQPLHHGPRVVRDEQGHAAAELQGPATRPSRCAMPTARSLPAGEAQARRAHRTRTQRGLLGQGDLSHGGGQGGVHQCARPPPGRNSCSQARSIFLLDRRCRTSSACPQPRVSWCAPGPENHTIFLGMNQGAASCAARTSKAGTLRGQARARNDEHRDQPRRGEARGDARPVGAAGIVAPPFIDSYDKAMDVGAGARRRARQGQLLAEASYRRLRGHAVPPQRPLCERRAIARRQPACSARSAS